MELSQSINPSKRKTIRTAIYLIALALSMPCWYSNLQAQTLPQLNQKPAAQDSVSKAEVIEAIPISNVISEGETTIREIRDIRKRVEEISVTAETDSSLVTIDSTFNAQRTKVFEDSLRNYNLRSLENTYTDFLLIKSQVQKLRDQVVSKREKLEPDIEKIKEMLKRWEKTGNPETAEEIPQTVRERIASVISNIEGLHRDAMEKNNFLLDKENQITNINIELDEVLNEISQKMAVEKEQFFAIDSPPIWTMLDVRGDSVSLVEEARESFNNQMNDLKLFRENYGPNFRNHLLLFLVLYLALMYFKHRVNNWSKEKKEAAAEASIQVINRPLAVALIISLIITPFNYPDAPTTATRLIYFWSIIPIVYLIPIVIVHIPKIFTYLFGLLFFLSEVAYFTEPYYIIDRLSLLVFCVVASSVFWYSLRQRSPLLSILRQRKMHFGIFILRFSLVLFIIGLIANILGNTVMSKIVSHGAFIIIFSGVLLYTTAMVLKSLFNLFLYSDESKNLFVVQKYPDDLRKGVNKTINLGLAVFWIYVALDAFLIYEPTIEWFRGGLEKEWKIGETTISLGSVVAFLITLWLSLFLSKIIRVVLQDEVLSRFEMKRGVPGAISMMVRIALITVGFILAFAAAGIKLSNIAIIFGALGVGIGFGLQNIFNNLISGIIIAFERPIQVGDIIQISTLNLMGEVRDIGIRSSIVKTFDGAEVVVPNGNIISNEMINWTLSDRRRRQEILVGVKYGTNLSKVLEILKEVVAEHDNVLKNPSPLIVFVGFGDSSLNFRVLFWTHFDVGLSTKSAVGVAIDEAFKANGIEIPFPQRDLHFKSTTPDFDKMLQSLNPGSQASSNKPSDKPTRTGSTGKKVKINPKTHDKGSEMDIDM